MAKITFTGINEYLQFIEKISDRSEEIAKKALYVGTEMIADAVKAEIRNLPTDESWGTPTNPAKGIRQVQKEGLLESFGIAPIRNENGYIHTAVGFDGYNSHSKTKKYPNGQPNQMIARIAASGTSFSLKTPFMEHAIRQAKKPAEAKMKDIFEKEIENCKKE